MWGKIMIQMYRLWLHGLYEPLCLLSLERLLNLIAHSFFSRTTLGVSALFVSCGTDVESVSHSPTLPPVSGCSEAVMVHEESASSVLPALSSLIASLLTLSKISIFVFLSPFWPALFTISNCCNILTCHICPLLAGPTILPASTWKHIHFTDRLPVLLWGCGMTNTAEVGHLTTLMATLVQGTAVLPGMPCHACHSGCFVEAENGGYRGRHWRGGGW